MKQSICEPTKRVPSANICINKSRVKLYNKSGEMPTYYLQKQTEFQIELFNPTTDVVLAKITLNNNSISQGGLILNPGQRIFLERYLDIPKKFLFDTYEVSNTNEVKKAIENNGDFKVEFFKEKKQFYYNPFILTTNNTGGTYDRTIYCGNQNNTIISSNNTSINTNTAYYNDSLMNTNVSMDSFNPTNVSYSQRTAPIKKDFKTISKSIETGRVEEGSSSEQKLKTIDKDFEYFSFHKIEYKMLPISQKINTSEDINVKVYCTSCANKLKKEYKYCPICSNKV